MSSAVQNAADMRKELDNQVVSLGIMETTYIKLNKRIKNFLPVKYAMRVGKFVTGITKAHKANAGLTKSQRKANKQSQKGLSVIQTLWVSMTAYGLSAKFAAKGTSTLGKALFSLVGSILFVFGIIMLLVLALGILAVVFADVNSPLVKWMEDTPVLGSMLNGLRIIITGEDGEGGLAGAMDVLTVALIAGTAAWILFGAPVAILVGTVVLAIGLFRWAKGYFDSWIAGVIAAVGVFAAGIAVYIFFFVEMFVTVAGVTATTTAGIVAGFLAGVALIAAGILGMWAYAKGAGDGILGVVLGVVSGILLFLGMLLVGVSFAIAWPIALGIFLVATIYRYRDEILSAFESAWEWLEELGSSIGTAFVSGVTWLGEVIFAILVVFGQIIVALFMTLIGYPVLAVLTFLWNLPGMLFGLGVTIGEATLGPLIAAGVWISNGIDWLLSLPGLLVEGVKDGLIAINNAIKGFWNSHIAAIFGPITIPDFVPKIGGKTFGPFPPYMAKGGIVSGPMSGYPATLHGTEAVIPLPDGRSIPVDMKGGGAVYNINVDASGIAVLSHTDKVNFAKEIGVMIKDEINKRNPFGM